MSCGRARTHDQQILSQAPYSIAPHKYTSCEFSMSSFTLVLDHSLACHEVVCVSVYRNIHVNFSTFLGVWKHVNVLGYFQCVDHCLKVDDV